MTLLASGDATVARVHGGLEALAEQHFKTNSRFNTHVRPGQPFREITKAARELEADLLIMATHGYPFFGVRLSPIIAGAAMSLSSVSVIANALWLRRTKL